jgi:hypothetical protein
MACWLKGDNGSCSVPFHSIIDLRVDQCLIRLVKATVGNVGRDLAVGLRNAWRERLCSMRSICHRPTVWFHGTARSIGER